MLDSERARRTYITPVEKKTRKAKAVSELIRMTHMGELEWAPWMSPSIWETKYQDWTLRFDLNEETLSVKRKGRTELEVTDVSDLSDLRGAIKPYPEEPEGSFLDAVLSENGEPDSSVEAPEFPMVNEGYDAESRESIVDTAMDKLLSFVPN